MSKEKAKGIFVRLDTTLQGMMEDYLNAHKNKGRKLQHIFTQALRGFLELQEPEQEAILMGGGKAMVGVAELLENMEWGNGAFSIEDWQWSIEAWLRVRGLARGIPGALRVAEYWLAKSFHRYARQLRAMAYQTHARRGDQRTPPVAKALPARNAKVEEYDAEWIVGHLDAAVAAADRAITVDESFLRHEKHRILFFNEACHRSFANQLRVEASIWRLYNAGDPRFRELNELFRRLISTFDSHGDAATHQQADRALWARLGGEWRNLGVSSDVIEEVELSNGRAIHALMEAISPRGDAPPINYSGLISDAAVDHDLLFLRNDADTAKQFVVWIPGRREASTEARIQSHASFLRWADEQLHSQDLNLDETKKAKSP